MSLPIAFAMLGEGLATLVQDAEGGEAAWSAAVREADRGAEPCWDMAMLRLRHGGWVRGFADWELRRHESWWREPAGLGPTRWDGSPLDGTLYLWAEQGLGDTLMLLRYLPLVRERCARVILGVQRPLIALAKALFPDLEVQFYQDVAPLHDAHVPMFSLPHVFGTTPETVPAPIRWSGPDLPKDAAFGVCWRGGDWQKIDESRDIPDDAAVRLLRGLAPNPVRVLDRRSPNEDAMMMVKRLARCTTVITTDRWITHLAGLMGIETHLILHRVGEWRWLRNRSDSVWYPTVTIHRQATAADWMGVVTDLVRGLV